MKVAVLDGRKVRAGEGAPREAFCPACGEPVRLCRQGGQIWVYRHAPGRGQECPARPRRRIRRIRLAGDPYLRLAAGVILASIRDASHGDPGGLAALAFSPIVRMGLMANRIDPYVAIPRILRRMRGNGEQGRLLATGDEAEVLGLVQEAPGIVLDLRPSPNGHGPKLEALDGYVPAEAVDPQLLPDVLGEILRLGVSVYILLPDTVPMGAGEDDSAPESLQAFLPSPVPMGALSL